jgi:hypothetical protein
MRLKLIDGKVETYKFCVLRGRHGAGRGGEGRSGAPPPLNKFLDPPLELLIAIYTNNNFKSAKLNYTELHCQLFTLFFL